MLPNRHNQNASDEREGIKELKEESCAYFTNNLVLSFHLPNRKRSTFPVHLLHCLFFLQTVLEHTKKLELNYTTKQKLKLSSFSFYSWCSRCKRRHDCVCVTLSQYSPGFCSDNLSACILSVLCLSSPVNVFIFLHIRVTVHHQQQLASDMQKKPQND